MTTTEEVRVVPVEEMDLEQYKAHVRAEALRVQESQGWCDEGLNEALSRLGLPEKMGPVEVPVDLLLKRRVTLRVTDADTREEATAKAATAEFIRDNYSLAGRDELVEVTAAPIKDPDELEVGDWDTSYAERRQCEHYDNGWYCTRAQGHGGKQHVASVSDRIVRKVWPVQVS